MNPERPFCTMTEFVVLVYYIITLRFTMQYFLILVMTLQLQWCAKFSVFATLRAASLRGLWWGTNGLDEVRCRDGVGRKYHLHCSEAEVAPLPPLEAYQLDSSAAL